MVVDSRVTTSAEFPTRNPVTVEHTAVTARIPGSRKSEDRGLAAGIR